MPRYDVTRVTRRHHEAGVDQPRQFEAVIHMEGNTEGDPVTLGDVKALLVAVGNQGVPDTAAMGTTFDIAFTWAESA